MSSTVDFDRYAKMIERMIGDQLPSPYPVEFKQDVRTLVLNQQPSGAFLAEDQNVHPEMRWFDELVILHAVANYAVTSGEEIFQKATKRAAEYHLAEIQPDHATSDPWGLLAFIQYAPPLADHLLHGVRLRYPQDAQGTTLLLLRDVLYGLRILMAENHEQ